MIEIKVPIHNIITNNVYLSDVLSWARENQIKDYDGWFISFSPGYYIVKFKNECDATAFRLKFG